MGSWSTRIVIYLKRLKNIEVASLKVALSVLNHQYSLTNSQGDIIIVRDRGVNQWSKFDLGTENENAFLSFYREWRFLKLLNSDMTYNFLIQLIYD